MAPETQGTMVAQVAAAQAPAVTLPDSPSSAAVQPAESSAFSAQVAPQADNQPVASPVVPAQELESPADSKLAEAEQRLKDTQRWGHEKAQEAAVLKSQLNVIMNQYGDVITAMEARKQVSQLDEGDAELDQAWQDYQRSPDDKTAYRNLIQVAEDRATKKAMKLFHEQLAQRETEARVQQRNIAAAQAINKAVSDVAPDLPLPLFWAMSGQAEAECPPEIQSFTERINWQVNRAIELGYNALRPALERTRAGVVQKQAVQQQAAAIMPSGGAAPSFGVPASSGQVPNMVDQLKAFQRRQGGQS